jgi:quinone-modifying oxidoreductase subunit QmoC
LLNLFFFSFSFLVLLVAISGVVRYWRALKSAALQDPMVRPVRGLFASIVAALKSIVTHDDFSQCTKSKPRLWSHLSVFFGFVALTLVTLWVITAKHNPLVQDTFVYPFGFWNPWKLLANLGGIAVLAGCLLMIWDRVKEGDQPGANSYSDWALIGTLTLVVLTGFFTEVLHYIRLEPHRHFAYFVHLMFVFTLLMYLPYSKFAHLIYRTTAVVFAEYIGRTSRTQPARAVEAESPQKEVASHAG